MERKIYNKKVKMNEGFIALTSTIIITAILLILVVSVSLAGFHGRFGVLDAELKEVSQGLAEGCVETAILNFAQKKDAYISMTTFPDPVSIGGVYTCDILNMTHAGSNVTVEVQAAFKSVYTNLEVTFGDTTPYGVISWREVPELP